MWITPGRALRSCKENVYISSSGKTSAPTIQHVGGKLRMQLSPSDICMPYSATER